MSKLYTSHNVVIISLIILSLNLINGQYNPYQPYQNYQPYPAYQNYNSGFCPPLSPPTNGVLASTCGNVVGSSCTFSCFSGYSLSGSSTLVCLYSGQWSSALPTCSLSSSNVIGYIAVPGRRPFWG